MQKPKHKSSSTKAQTATRLPIDSFSSWGVKLETKTVFNLWSEISAGKTSLNLSDLHRPIRTIHVGFYRAADEVGAVEVRLDEIGYRIRPKDVREPRVSLGYVGRCTIVLMD
ncbi:hypothetical protein QJS04_geneDACA001865 [Acorus gramineus]|uniref:Uncharacterized protein n=1 Tax=Acorus gramineus TaxID=55184 RepID=A0AAV9BHE5_ACOGR|nr:hypothetical protein QJS04_geneDACA001865 [Acorus gramineus]